MFALVPSAGGLKNASNAMSGRNGETIEQSATVVDSPDCAGNASLGVSFLAGWLFNGLSGYIDDNNADNVRPLSLFLIWTGGRMKGKYACPVAAN